jgi:AAA domain, putative AbiEii toxin, Type IV TA system
MVGANNAGKSTVVEALRLIALVTARLLPHRRRILEPPDWLEHPEGFAGVRPAFSRMTAAGFEPSIFHQYGLPPAIVTAVFSSGATVTAFVGPDAQVHGVARQSDGSEVTRSTVSDLGLSPVAVQPQVAPLLRDEPIRQEETILRGDGTYLAPQHFRNQLRIFDSVFQDFVSIAEVSWPGLQVLDLEPHLEEPTRPIELLVRDGGFVGEVGLMGHGLQMWLQIVWFLARAPSEGTVVLDEPDVYMHPDLQRRLLSLVRTRFSQLVIATHSVEIISDVDPRSILAIDRRQSSSEFVTSLPGLEGVMDGIGSVQNIQLTRLMRATSFYLVEGEDVKLLRILQATVDPGQTPIDLIPHADLGGRGGWDAGVPERVPKSNAEGDQIRAFAILDRDYFPDDEVAERYEEARRWKIQLRVWSRKELENYLLVPGAIARFIFARVSDSQESPGSTQVTEKIEELIDEMREEPIQDAVAAVLNVRDKKGGHTKATRLARQRVKEAWKSQESRWSVAPGKDLLSRLSRWSQETFGVGFGAEQIARELRKDEIAPEVIEVIAAITEGRSLRRAFAMPTK